MDIKQLEGTLFESSEWETIILELPTAVVKAVCFSDERIRIYAFRKLEEALWALIFSVDVSEAEVGTVIDLISSAITLVTMDMPAKKATR